MRIENQIRILLLGSVLLFPLIVKAKVTTYEQCFKQASSKYKIPYSLLTAIAFTESSFWPNAKNRKTNDYGFMQINILWRKVARKHGFDWNKIKNDPCHNVEFGAWILRANYKRMKSWAGAVGAYNVGFGTSNKARTARAKYYRKVIRNKTNARRYSHRLRKKNQSKAKASHTTKKDLKKDTGQKQATLSDKIMFILNTNNHQDNLKSFH